VGGLGPDRATGKLPSPVLAGVKPVEPRLPKNITRLGHSYRNVLAHLALLQKMAQY